MARKQQSNEAVLLRALPVAGAEVRAIAAARVIVTIVATTVSLVVTLLLPQGPFPLNRPHRGVGMEGITRQGNKMKGHGVFSEKSGDMIKETRRILFNFQDFSE